MPLIHFHYLYFIFSLLESLSYLRRKQNTLIIFTHSHEYIGLIKNPLLYP